MSSATQFAQAAPPVIVRPPRLLVEWEPWGRTFLGNLADLCRPAPPPVLLTSQPAAFWPDVFVERPPPWGLLSLSAVYHVISVVLIVLLTGVFMNQPQVLAPDVQKDTRLTYYDVTEYLPEIRTGSAPAKKAFPGEPEYARQRIVSIPLEPDNSTQTIVDPTGVRIIPQHVALPNLVASAPTPDVEVTAGSRNSTQLTVPWLAPEIVPPPPDASARTLADLNLPRVPQPAAVPPMEQSVARQIGDLNVGPYASDVTAPKIPLEVQQSTGNVGEVEGAPARPSATVAGSQATGQLLALGIKPVAPSGPIEMPQGNRRGIFAAGPEGRPGAAGTPDIHAIGAGPGGTGSGAGGPGNAPGNSPAGIEISGGPSGSRRPGAVAAVSAPPPAGPDPTFKQQLLAAAQEPARVPPNLGGSTSGPVTGLMAESPEEQKVFGTKQYYTLALNMPNFTSAGGSWIIRFAERGAPSTLGDVSAPVPTTKIDPSYPAAVIRDRVEGTVVLYAEILEDGHVGQVRVLRGLDERLDTSAVNALKRWVFRPARKNGLPVALEAVIQVPFRVPKLPW